jgi:dynein heavy chain
VNCVLACARARAGRQAKLKLPLLAYQKDAGHLLTVNFDPALVKLLREVKYFLLLGLEVPGSALDIFQKAETFRRQTGNLDLLVNMYNRMVSEMLPVEAPLMKAHMTKIETALQAGLKDINWKSTAIEGFIADAQVCIRDAHDVLFQTKDNLREIQGILDKWCAEPLLQRKPKPVTSSELAASQKQLIAARFQEIKAGGLVIDKKLQASHVVMKVAKAHPNWRAYADFTNSVVIMGLSRLVIKSLQYLCEQLDADRIAAQNIRPLMLIKLDLVGDSVRFVPDVEESRGESSVWGIVNGWVDSFYQAATLFKRLDDAEGRYVKELSDDMYVQMLLATVNEHLSSTEEKCLAFKATFDQFSHLWTTDLKQMFATFLESALVPVASGDKVPDLEKFGAEISRLKKLQVKINDLKTPTDIAWLRVSSEPIKQALATCVTKWIFTFTEYLQKHVLGRLNDLNDMVNRVTVGLKEEVHEGDESKEPLKRVMGHIRDVKKAMDTTATMFGPLRDTVALLRSHGVHVEQHKIGGTQGVMEFLETAPLKWDATVNITFKKKEDIFPLQNAEMDNIKAQVEGFFLSVREFRNRFRKTAPFSFTGPADEAYGSVNAFFKELAGVEVGAVALNELEELFELPISKYNETADTRSELVLLKRLWDFKELVRFSYDDWQTALWNDVNTEALEDKNKKLSAQLKRFGDSNQIVKGWQVYRDLEKEVKNMGVSLPLVNDLHAPFMRPRHWKEVARVCECKALDPSDPKFSLEDLLSKQLHNHADDIMEIVETASKELKIERKMEAIEKVWNSLDLDYVPHKDSDVFVVRPSDQVVESLEEHQMELQVRWPRVLWPPCDKDVGLAQALGAACCDACPRDRVPARAPPAAPQPW